MAGDDTWLIHDGLIGEVQFLDTLAAAYGQVVSDAEPSWPEF
jgi:hypothetical protein